MDRDLIPDHIELKLYLIEALLLEKYFIKVWENLRQLKHMASDQDFFLVEYYKKQFVKDVLRIKRLYKPKKAYTIKMPLSVSRVLWKNWQEELITQDIQNILGGIDKQLGNAGLKPVKDAA